MDRSELIGYEGESVQLDYTKGDHPHSRTGLVYSVAIKVVVFWPFEDDNQEVEILIPFEEIDDIKKL